MVNYFTLMWILKIFCSMKIQKWVHTWYNSWVGKLRDIKAELFVLFTIVGLALASLPSGKNNFKVAIIHPWVTVYGKCLVYDQKCCAVIYLLFKYVREIIEV